MHFTALQRAKACNVHKSSPGSLAGKVAQTSLKIFKILKSCGIIFVKYARKSRLGPVWQKRGKYQ
jgi:hypothetical protein